MITSLICLATAIALYFTGGFLRGLFEAVILFDSVDDWLGPRWAFKLFGDDKDRNHDGKVSFMELNFPNDNTHRAKLYEILCYAFASCFLAIGAGFLLMSCTTKIPALPLTVISFTAPFVIWWIVSVGFLVSFNKYRKVK